LYFFTVFCFFGKKTGVVGLLKKSALTPVHPIIINSKKFYSIISQKPFHFTSVRHNSQYIRQISKKQHRIRRLQTTPDASGLSLLLSGMPESKH